MRDIRPREEIKAEIDTPFRIHKQVKKYRAELGLTQKELAAMSGVSLPTLIKIESGHNPNPTIVTLASIAHELDVGVDELLGIYPYKVVPKKKPAE